MTATVASWAMITIGVATMVGCAERARLELRPGPRWLRIRQAGINLVFTESDSEMLCLKDQQYLIWEGHHTYRRLGVGPTHYTIVAVFTIGRTQGGAATHGFQAFVDNRGAILARLQATMFEIASDGGGWCCLDSRVQVERVYYEASPPGSRSWTHIPGHAGLLPQSETCHMAVTTRMRECGLSGTLRATSTILSRNGLHLEADGVLVPGAVGANNGL